MLIRCIVFSLFTFIMAGCGQPNQISYNRPFGSSSLSFSGFLLANTCNTGESVIVYENRAYAKGRRSVSQFDQLIVDIKNNELESQMLEDRGCERVYPLEFNGEFEQEVDVLSNGGQEQRNVIQVYQFRVP